MLEGNSRRNKIKRSNGGMIDFKKAVAKCHSFFMYKYDMLSGVILGRNWYILKTVLHIGIQ